LEIAGDKKWTIYRLELEHTHSFVHEEDMHLMSSNRELTLIKKHMIHSMSKLNLGPVKAFNVLRTVFGGFEEVGASKEDCKNFKSELNLYIGEYDCDMVVAKLMDKKKYMPNFSCDYITGDNGTLKGLFWADEYCKKNYFTFGDVVSFDATYRSKK